jgi:hypothetical protein
MGLRRQSIRQRAQLRTMLRAVEAVPRSASTANGAAPTAGSNSEGAR